MNAELVNDLLVSRYTVFAEMAWLEPRPELRAICRLAREAGAQLTSQVVQEALPGLAPSGADNIVRWCADLGLTDRHGGLTELGEETADSGEAPVPEQGLYDFWVTDHGLLGARILHADRVQAFPDNNINVEPPEIEPEHGRPFTSVLSVRQRFVLRKFPSVSGLVGVRKRPTQARCEVRWELDWDSGRSEVTISGELDGQRKSDGPREVKHKPEPVDVDLWQLVQDWANGPLARHGRWSAEHRLLLTGPGSLTPAEQETFRKNLDLGPVEVQGRGQWSQARLTQVPVGPGSAAGAQLWALARLDRRLGGDETRYPRAAVRGLFADLTEDTPLEAFQPELPRHEALLARYAQHPEVFWRLTAPVDLAPTEASAEELGPMIVGAAVPAYGQPASAGPSEVVRVPYPGGWSMRTLVDQLVEPHGVRRFLLVDRFERGPDDLVGLEVLEAALAELGYSSLDVWVGDEVDDVTVGEIARISDREPRRYRKAFGASGQPHDCYAVVVPRTGPPFGWQLSASPLESQVVDAAPDTPMRWHDLTATRRAAERLRPEMAAWARGELE